MRLHHRQDQRRGHGRIEKVPRAIEDFGPGVRRQLMTGSDNEASPRRGRDRRGLSCSPGIGSDSCHGDSRLRSVR